MKCEFSFSIQTAYPEEIVDSFDHGLWSHHAFRHACEYDAAQYSFDKARSFQESLLFGMTSKKRIHFYQPNKTIDDGLQCDTAFIKVECQAKVFNHRMVDSKMRFHSEARRR